MGLCSFLDDALQFFRCRRLTTKSTPLSLTLQILQNTSTEMYFKSDFHSKNFDILLPYSMFFQQCNCVKT